MEKKDQLQVQREDEVTPSETTSAEDTSQANETTDVKEETSQKVTSEPAKGKPEEEVAEPEAQKEDDGLEVWFSRTDPKHMLLLKIEEDGKAFGSVSFENYTLVLDLDDPQDKLISEELHKCDRKGKDIFVIGEVEEGHQHGNKVQMMKKLREYGDEYDGLNRLAALFTRKELIEADINPANPDKDAMIVLALETKKIGDM